MQSQVQAAAAATLIVLAMTSARPARAEEPSPPPPAEARIVNITPDSAPGWVPSKDQARAASEAVLAYLAARDVGRAEAAYAMLADGTEPCSRSRNLRADWPISTAAPALSPNGASSPSPGPRTRLRRLCGDRHRQPLREHRSPLRLCRRLSIAGGRRFPRER